METSEFTAEAPATAPHESRLDALNAPRASDPDQPSLIKWMTARQIQEVSIRLESIKQAAMRSEAKGDYFKSGELAFQIREIIHATAALLIKSRRAKG